MLQTAIQEHVDVGFLTDRLVTGLIQRYLAEPGPRKLHIGCERRSMAGWLNTDLVPNLPAVLPLDARERFPFEDSTFDYVYTEHMIEHLSYPAAVYMLRESLRVLKPGGKIRICTPDLHFLIRLCMCPSEPRNKRYIAWAANEFEPVLDRRQDSIRAVHVMNNFVRAWGHQFVFDRDTLRDALMRAGFTSIEEAAFMHSDDAELCGIEHISRLPPGILEIESMMFEAVKPRGSSAAIA